VVEARNHLEVPRSDYRTWSSLIFVAICQKLNDMVFDSDSDNSSEGTEETAAVKEEDVKRDEEPAPPPPSVSTSSW
jgi:hypothetical protein